LINVRVPDVFTEIIEEFEYVLKFVDKLRGVVMVLDDEDNRTPLYGRIVPGSVPGRTPT